MGILKRSLIEYTPVRKVEWEATDSRHSECDVAGAAERYTGGFTSDAIDECGEMNARSLVKTFLAGSSTESSIREVSFNRHTLH